MVTDPLLASVGWSWLLDALASHDAEYVAPSGTVTSVSSESFGSMSDEPARRRGRGPCVVDPAAQRRRRAVRPRAGLGRAAVYDGRSAAAAGRGGRRSPPVAARNSPNRSPSRCRPKPRTSQPTGVPRTGPTGAGSRPTPGAPAAGRPDVDVTAEQLDAIARGAGRRHRPVAVDAERAHGFRYSQRAYLLQLRRAGAGTHLIDPVAYGQPADLPSSARHWPTASGSSTPRART